MEYAIRITTWEFSEVKEKIFSEGDEYVICFETGKQSGNKHIHIYLKTNTRIETLRKRLKSNYKGIYSCTKCKDKESYLKYMSKEQNWISDPELDVEQYYDEWIEDGKKITKCRNKATNGIINDMIDFIGTTYEMKNGIVFHWTNFLSKTLIETCKKYNGLVPQPMYYMQVKNTIIWHLADDEQKWQIAKRFDKLADSQYHKMVPDQDEP